MCAFCGVGMRPGLEQPLGKRWGRNGVGVLRRCRGEGDGQESGCSSLTAACSFPPSPLPHIGPVPLWGLSIPGDTTVPIALGKSRCEQPRARCGKGGGKCSWEKEIETLRVSWWDVSWCKRSPFELSGAFDSNPNALPHFEGFFICLTGKLKWKDFTL